MVLTRGTMAMVALGLSVLAAGCLQPPTAGAEPDRPSVPFDAPIDGLPMWLNGTVHVSMVPGEAANLISPEAPHNCFSVSSTGEARSFLGGVVIDLEWAAAAPETQVLNVSVEGYGGTTWSVEGPSPLRLVGMVDDSHAIVTPFPVTVVPAQGPLPPLQAQAVEFRLYLGALESELGALEWTQCSSIPDLPA